MEEDKYQDQVQTGLGNYFMLRQTIVKSGVILNLYFSFHAIVTLVSL